MISRRKFLQFSTTGLALASTAILLPKAAHAADVGPAALPRGTLDESLLATLPGKKPLIKRSFRAPNYETPVAYFNELFTPNDAFFVRYHLANIPEVDAREWRLRIGGAGAQRPLELSLEDLKNGFEHVELAAVCQCSGNRRGLFDPHVAGVEWGYGAMGNAKWTGVRVKDVLAKAGVTKDALEVVLNGADAGVLDKTPDFVKSLPVTKALHEDTILAFAMNGQPLPRYNGYPVRLIVPGWTATYWTKHITSLELITQPFDGFWVKTAYRIPTGKFPVVERFLSQENATSTPISEMVVNSLITNLQDGQRLPAGRPVEVKGIAWDAGYGIAKVEVSVDGGQSWREAGLGVNAGKYSWRQWSYRFRPKKGVNTVMAKATNSIGQSQTFALIHNPAGYHHNVVQHLTLHVA
jgi:DMSO/TMAO reductase YedYZ molybdopterin-dependent catalytic subunit